MEDQDRQRIDAEHEAIEEDVEEAIENVSSGLHGSHETQIQELLDLGYEQLDSFVQWLEDRQGIGTRVAQQDCFNAEALLDYLANHHRKTATEINEFDLRWFVFSHSIRKSVADAETERRLLESLSRFFEFLRVVHSEPLPDWLFAVLEDDSYYQSRLNAYRELSQSDEEAWEQGFRDWCTDLEDDLDARSLWLPRDLGGAMEWGNVMGLFEASLYEEANNNWQKQRQSMLRDGLDTEALRYRLAADYYAWLDTPQARLADETPRERIVQERLGRSEEPFDDAIE